VHVKLNPAVYPKEVKKQMKKIEFGEFKPEDIDRFQEHQWAYAKRVVNSPLRDSFIIEDVKDYKWPEATCKNQGKRKDNDYKNVPVK
jgi:formylmethanofuran dehydrogenase subunit E